VPPRHCTGIERPLTRFPISHHNERSFCALLLTIKRIVAKYFAMRFSSFFTPSSSTNTGAAAILLGFSLWASSVHAQDRTTEAGEAAITGAYFSSLAFNLLARHGSQCSEWHH
jgi:hypothetical protein